LSHWPERYPKPRNLLKEFSLQFQSNQLISSESWNTIDKKSNPGRIEVEDCHCDGILSFKVKLDMFNETKYLEVAVKADFTGKTLREAILEEFSSKI